jgi:hypothetical protein
MDFPLDKKTASNAKLPSQGYEKPAGGQKNK